MARSSEAKLAYMREYNKRPKTEEQKRTAAECAKRWRLANPEKVRASQRRYNSKPSSKEAGRQKSVRRRQRDPAGYMLTASRMRARKRGLEHSISKEDIVMPTHCPVLGIPLVFNEWKYDDNSPSLDRVDNSKGYVKGNVRVISNRANSLKRDASLGEVLAVYEYMLNELGDRCRP